MDVLTGPDFGSLVVAANSSSRIDTTPSPNGTGPSYHAIPLFDGCHWERQCDAALSMRSGDSSQHSPELGHVSATRMSRDDHATLEEKLDESKTFVPESGTAACTGNHRVTRIEDTGDHRSRDLDYLLNDTGFHDVDAVEPRSTDNVLSTERHTLLDRAIGFQLSKEITILNVSRSRLNNLNAAMSIILVVCSVLGIGLFLRYMLS